MVLDGAYGQWVRTVIAIERARVRETITEREFWTLQNLAGFTANVGPLPFAVMTDVRSGCLGSLRRRGLTARTRAREWYVTAAGHAYLAAVEAARAAA